MNYVEISISYMGLIGNSNRNSNLYYTRYEMLMVFDNSCMYEVKE